ncbi:MAG: UDP-N-acetylglucosamine diphosphorylase [Schlesneria sp.]|nr:UDP-N-acetylglucosamine diphosphorylase [Schlesneria sp.]
MSSAVANESTGLNLVSADHELSAALLDHIQQLNQGEVLRFWERLSADDRGHLAHQLAQLDWDFVEGHATEHAPADTQLSVDSHVTAPSHSIRWPESPAERHSWSEAAEEGRDFLQSGRIAVVVVAGGVATRLGTSYPKGMFPIGPISGRSLFHLLAEQVLALSQRYQIEIPYLIMTSEATHVATEQWFEQQHWFGLDPKNVSLFQQGTVPAFDSTTGKLLMSSESSLALNPDGHGGLPFAMSRAGLFKELQDRGIETLFYHQVDNPLVHVCDPAFIGLHLRHAAEVSVKFVGKQTPDERVGLLVEIDGRTRMIEYSDLPESLGTLQDRDGKLQLRAGNTGIHLFQRTFLERIAAQPASLPWHTVHKKVAYLDAEGTLVHPESENALKYERFIFDSFSIAKSVLAVETLRETEFAPLKNAEGECSADIVKQAIIAATATRLRSAGVTVTDGTAVEIANVSPDDALTFEAGCPRQINQPTLFNGIRRAAGFPFVRLQIQK